MAFYLDTSAAVKLVVPEPATRLLSTWARTHAESLISSDLLRTELLRATRRGAPDQMSRARAVLDSITIVALPTATFERAADLETGLMRSLDAVHLAAALELGDDLDGIITYDERLAEAAAIHGATVVAPR